MTPDLSAGSDSLIGSEAEGGSANCSLRVAAAGMVSTPFATMPGHHLRNTGSLTGMSRIDTSLTHASASRQLKGTVKSVSITSFLIDTRAVNLSYAKPIVTSSRSPYTIGGD